MTYGFVRTRSAGGLVVGRRRCVASPKRSHYEYDWGPIQETYQRVFQVTRVLMKLR